MHRFIASLALACVAPITVAAAARRARPPPPPQPLPQPPPSTQKDFVAICGDSITEQKLYSVFIEDYLLMCQPADEPPRDAVRLGRRDRAAGSSGASSNVLRFPVTVATTCYGMNDGGYAPLTPERAKAYREAR